MKKQLFFLSSMCLMLTSCQNMNESPEKARNAQDRMIEAENETDRGITQKIRQSLMDDDSLSINAKNVKIITTNGVVTLRGTVNNEREKNEIGRKTKAVSGVKSVDNQLEIVRSENPTT